MKAFPENITRATFATSWDGRLTTEAQLLTQRATVFLQNGRNYTDKGDLRQAIAVLLLFARSQDWPPRLVLALAGIISGAIDRQIYGLVGRCFMRFVGAWLENVLARSRGLDQNSPAWNDYLMSYWMMTGNPEAVEELFYRAIEPVKDPALLPAKESAAWIIETVRHDCAEFDRAYREVEAQERGAAAVEKALA